jgi:hypothetical protein
VQRPPDRPEDRPRTHGNASHDSKRPNYAPSVNCERRRHHMMRQRVPLRHRVRRARANAFPCLLQLIEFVFQLDRPPFFERLDCREDKIKASSPNYNAKSQALTMEPGGNLTDGLSQRPATLPPGGCWRFKPHVVTILLRIGPTRRSTACLTSIEGARS